MCMKSLCALEMGSRLLDSEEASMVNRMVMDFKSENQW